MTQLSSSKVLTGVATALIISAITTAAVSYASLVRLTAIADMTERRLSDVERRSLISAETEAKLQVEIMRTAQITQDISSDIKEIKRDHVMLLRDAYARGVKLD